MEVAPPPAASPTSPIPVATDGALTRPGSIQSNKPYSTAVDSVVDAWREYDEGLGGRPSLRSVYEAPGFTFGKTRATEKKFWERCLPILREIERLAGLHQLEAKTAASKLDNWRLKQVPVPSLFKLSCLIGAGSQIDLFS